MGGGPAGDLLVEVEVGSHRHFTRKGDDIHFELPVSVPEAVLGGQVEGPTPGGPVAVSIAKGSNTGTVLRLRGRACRIPMAPAVTPTPRCESCCRTGRTRSSRHSPLAGRAERPTIHGPGWKGEFESDDFLLPAARDAASLNVSALCAVGKGHRHPRRACPRPGAEPDLWERVHARRAAQRAALTAAAFYHVLGPVLCSHSRSRRAQKHTSGRNTPSARASRNAAPISTSFLAANPCAPEAPRIEITYF
ncbi:MAG TPA: J domain-containing protein [Acetobacteraceae bacterium]|nr:J domain-containing protein [Acetobacteraceae bacterium]